jgi:uncharacterized protein YjbI with pentapeptide repeats
MQKDFSHQNLQRASFRNEDLSNARFSNTDLRGTDFTGSDLRGADFNHVKTGITPVNTSLIFVAALVVSAFSGYVAMLTGRTIQAMLASDDSKIRTAGIASLVIILLFIIFSLWKGVGNAVYKLVIPVIVLASVLGIIAYVSGMGTGRGMLFLALSLVLVVAMFIVGTIARAAAGSLSTNLIFIAVAMAGAMFGKSVGGGIGTVILAISCALISKRALSGAKGFESIRKITYYITSKFGTSFRSSRLADAHFSRSRIRNSDFSNADIALVNWGDSKKVNCLANETLLIEKKESERQGAAENTDTRQE